MNADAENPTNSQSEIESWLSTLDDLVRSCDGVAGLDPRLVDDAETALDEIRERLTGNAGDDESEHVAEAYSCPNCGETHQDALVWRDDESIVCTSCGASYSIDSTQG